jgi:branched-chain amino acid transport system permease protein
LVGCFAVGAYTSALLTKAGFAIGVGMLAACVVTALVGVAVSLVTIRLRGDYLAIVTLGFAETVRIVASNAIPLTNGTDGVSGIPCSCSRSRVSRYRFCRRSRPSKALRFASS